jgi:hypothetical protein
MATYKHKSTDANGVTTLYFEGEITMEEVKKTCADLGIPQGAIAVHNNITQFQSKGAGGAPVMLQPQLGTAKIYPPVDEPLPLP